MSEETDKVLTDNHAAAKTRFEEARKKLDEAREKVNAAQVEEAYAVRELQEADKALSDAEKALPQSEVAQEPAAQTGSRVNRPVPHPVVSETQRTRKG